MIPQLPTELKVSIFKHADKRSLLTVMRANSVFHGIAEPIVYSTVYLTPFVRREGLADATIACFHVLVTRPTAAAAVRCLALNFRQGYDVHLHTGMVWRVFEALRSALPRLLDLEKLLISHWGSSFPGPDLLPNLPLPSLQHYRGPPELLKDLQSRDLVNLRICSSGPRFEPSYRALLVAACHNGWKIRVLELDHSGDISDERSLELISDIHGLFPNLKYLGLGSWVSLSNGNADRIAKNISKFQDIRLFSIFDRWGNSLSSQLPLVQILHAGCEQLRAICLSDEEWRFSEDLHRWITIGDALDFPGSAQLWKAADYRKYLVDPESDGFVYNSLDY
ncbi:hypothetical protein M407DRAFT_24576 [Tulasnella calospora MUT 4182]|uniref:F-box domain-containing protein n=1 Tax=Tulasnella calospora MUT 4182 TaxID=1051891 RepID=A0A0C3KXK4_9AGAM|nr:hypothetical protein M407DRAFT_24576 [Tulasnella calospora MUT 4182]